MSTPDNNLETVEEIRRTLRLLCLGYGELRQQAAVSRVVALSRRFEALLKEIETELKIRVGA